MAVLLFFDWTNKLFKMFGQLLYLGTRGHSKSMFIHFHLFLDPLLPLFVDVCFKVPLPLYVCFLFCISYRPIKFRLKVFKLIGLFINYFASTTCLDLKQLDFFWFQAPTFQNEASDVRKNNLWKGLLEN